MGLVASAILVTCSELGDGWRAPPLPVAAVDPDGDPSVNDITGTPLGALAPSGPSKKSVPTAAAFATATESATISTVRVAAAAWLDNPARSA